MKITFYNNLKKVFVKKKGENLSVRVVEKSVFWNGNDIKKWKKVERKNI